MTALAGAAAALVMVGGVQKAFAIEPGDFGPTLTGATIGALLAPPTPPGLYGVLDSFAAPAGKGYGQDAGTTVAVPLWAPTLFWSTGYHVLGANLSMALVQPFYWLAAYPTNGATLAGNGSGPPFGGAVWWTTMSNTLITPVLLQWQLGGGWFANAGVTLIPPDGSRYNGALNPDYFTWEPRAALAYVDADWHLTANFKYDINSASSGHTGTYQIAANLPPLAGTPLAPVVAGIGNGYRSGQEAFLDLAATHIWGKWEIGPVASLKWQTTSDSPGGGFTCAQVAALLGPTLGCGRATNYSLGGLVGYNFGLMDVQTWVTDSVYTKDDYGGLAFYSRLTFRLWGPEASTSPMPTKAH